MLVPGFGQAVTVGLTYRAIDDVLENPYIGNVVWATDTEERAQPFSMVYADLTWADFEPEKGAYAFEAFEERVNLAYWREQGKHVVLRFVLDKPGDKKHMDIPQWLYDEIDGDGEYYNISYGRGFNPNYENDTLIKAHQKAVAALGNRYGDDNLIAFVQLGSLGHWGEWHVHSKITPLPLEAVRDTYVSHYVEAFPNTHLMMRRPFTHAEKYGMGLYNDASASPDSTETWLDWIESGGAYEHTGEENGLVAMPDAWRSVPIGGELSTSYKAEKLLDDMFDSTLALFERSHSSWVGPGSFAGVEKDGRYQSNLNTLMRTLGYRLRVSKLDISDISAGMLRFSTTWRNDGIAPFYFDWQPCLLVQSDAGERQIYPLEGNIRDIQPDALYNMQVALDKQALPAGLCQVYVGIVDPATNEPGIALAMDVQSMGRWYHLAEIMVR